jgi:hypothetical protein
MNKMTRQSTPIAKGLVDRWPNGGALERHTIGRPCTRLNHEQYLPAEITFHQGMNLLNCLREGA